MKGVARPRRPWAAPHPAPLPRQEPNFRTVVETAGVGRRILDEIEFRVTELKGGVIALEPWINGESFSAANALYGVPCRWQTFPSRALTDQSGERRVCAGLCACGANGCTDPRVTLRAWGRFVTWETVGTKTPQNWVFDRGLYREALASALAEYHEIESDDDRVTRIIVERANFGGAQEMGLEVVNASFSPDRRWVEIGFIDAFWSCRVWVRFPWEPGDDDAATVRVLRDIAAWETENIVGRWARTREPHCVPPYPANWRETLIGGPDPSIRPPKRVSAPRSLAYERLMAERRKRPPDVEIVLGEETNIDGVPDGYELVSASLGLDGVVTCAWAPSAAMAFVRAPTWSRHVNTRPRVGVPDWAAFPFATMPDPVNLLITATRDSVTAITVTRGIDLRFPKIVRLPRSGDFIVATSRCRFRFKVPEKNARRISPGGEILDEGTLGDDINHLAATLEDDIWVSYGDEGVFGVFDWGPRGEPSNGTGGLMRFRPDFTVDWTYSLTDRVDICDCYTMNLGPEGLYFCPYPDFPVARLANGHHTVWERAGWSASHIVVAGSHVAFLRRYGPTPKRGTLVNLATGELRTVGLRGPGSVDWPADSTAAVAGDSIVVVRGRSFAVGRLHP